jgi:hypothetical protein
MIFSIFLGMLSGEWQGRGELNGNRPFVPSATKSIDVVSEFRITCGE